MNNIRINLLAIFFGITFFVLSLQEISGQVITRFDPMVKSLYGLQELSYVKTALSGQPSRQSTGKISQNHAIKTIKNAGSPIGFSYTEKVQDLLDFYTSDSVRRNVEIMLGLAPDYLPMFESILKKEELPAELKYLPMALSSLNTRAVSAWGASGLWQLMFTTGKLYNLQIDSYVDERKDPEKSTAAAVAYLKDLYGVYLDWELTIAAYTNGPASVNKAMRKAGGSRKYDDLYPFLPAETREYYPAFIACYIIASHPDQGNLKPIAVEVPNFRQKEPVEKRLHLGQIAGALSIPLPLLQDMNPEYKSSIIPVGTKSQWVKLPLDKINIFSALGDSVYAFQDSVFFPSSKRANVVTEPPVQQIDKADTGQQTQTEDQTTSSSSGKVIQQDGQRADHSHKTKLEYTVKEGDNLGFISGWYDVSIADIKRWNQIKKDIIKVGQKLEIYVPEAKVNQYKGIEGMTFEQKQKKSSPAQAVKPDPARQKTQSASGNTVHTVGKGETISGIAAKYPGVSADDIMKLNNIKDPRNLQVGQKLKIPKK